jgi:hypothetical protein
VNVTVNQAGATVALSGLLQTYTGNAINVTAGTTPSGLTVNLTYNGNAAAPTNAGSYTVVGTINDANYYGSATNTLVISQAAATVTLGNLAQVYDDTAKSVTATTTPTNLTVNFIYNGSANAPTNAGSYTVIGTVSSANYAGSATNTLVIGQATAIVTLTNLVQTYDSAAKSVSVITSPTNLTVNLTYNGSADAPTNVGSYAVIGTVVDPNYAGSATNTLVINSVTNLVAGTMNLGVQAGQTAALPLAKLLLRSTDPFGETLRVVSADSVSANGGAVVLGDSVINYTPANGYSGPDTFNYVIADTGGNTATGIITVTVTAAGGGSGGSYNQLAVETVGSAVRLSYLGIPGTNYALEVTHDLTPPVTWTPVLTNPAAANGLLVFTNTPTGGQSFYRTRYVP